MSARAENAAGVSGRVLLDHHPVANATVYAYQVVERSFQKALTDPAGQFLFRDLPAGLYKIVAHKAGTPPAVLVLARRAAGDSQFVQVELADDSENAAGDFWELRADVPGDVLRDLAPTLISLASRYETTPNASRLDGQLSATAGFEQLRSDMTAQVSGANVDVQGAVGAMKLQVAGEFRNMVASLGGSDNSLTGDGVFGRAASFDLGLSSDSSGVIGLSGESHQLSLGPSDPSGPVDFSSYQVRYAKDFGEVGSTSLNAQYVNENGIYSGSRFAPRVLPGSSSLLTIQGSFARTLGDTGQLRSGLRFREVVSDDPRLGPDGRINQFMDLWSRGQNEVAPALVLQYGLYTTLRDGSVSLLPKGGLLVHLTPEWQASLSASHRMVATTQDPFADDFAPVIFDEEFACEDADTACYEGQLLHGEGEDNSIRFRGSWREFDRTLRIFLRDDFLATTEGFFFVPGDRLPQVHASIRRRLGRTVVAKLSSSYASGGGGEYLAANRGAYENGVAFMTTSLDTKIEPTSTGFYLSFQRFEQHLVPLDRRGRRVGGQEAQLQRVEFVVSQDLSALFDLAANWAVQVGMEVAKGGTLLAPTVENNDYRRSLTTGLAVRF